MMEAVDIADPESQGANGQLGSATEQGGGGFLPDAEAGGFMPVDDSSLAPSAGGFLPDAPESGDQARAGGFLPENSSAGGGFLPEDPNAGGGFLPEEPEVGGGFLPEPQTGTAGPGEPGTAGEGGFLLDDDPALAGGFLPVPANISAADVSEMRHDLDFAAEGGFLPLPDVPQGFMPDSDSGLPLPEPGANPPPDRIALNAIPAALRRLGLHQVGLQGTELMALFEEVASDDEDATGGKSVRRERFREACEVLLGSDDEAGEDSDVDEYRDDADVADDNLQEPGRRRLRKGATKAEAPTRVQPARRSTRAHPQPEGEGAATPTTVDEMDFGAALDALPDEEDEDGHGSYGSASDEEDTAATRGKSGGKGAKKSRRGRRTIDPSQPLSDRDLAAASDTFDLFFEDSPQLPFAQKDRYISLLELQRACGVLKEKMSEGDVSRSIDSAATRSG